jgi:hypothetical protein
MRAYPLAPFAGDLVRESGGGRAARSLLTAGCSYSRLTSGARGSAPRRWLRFGVQPMRMSNGNDLDLDSGRSATCSLGRNIFLSGTKDAAQNIRKRRSKHDDDDRAGGPSASGSPTTRRGVTIAPLCAARGHASTPWRPTRSYPQSQGRSHGKLLCGCSVCYLP